MQPLSSKYHTNYPITQSKSCREHLQNGWSYTEHTGWLQNTVKENVLNNVLQQNTDRQKDPSLCYDHVQAMNNKDTDFRTFCHFYYTYSWQQYITFLSIRAH